MGYTHYWKMPTGLDSDRFAIAFMDVKRIVEAAGVPLAGGDGTGEPIFDAETIVFNGEGDDAYETFFIEPGRPEDFDFCKTAQKPYDLAVTAALVVLKHHFRETIEISSDGDVEGFEDALDLYVEVFESSPNFGLNGSIC